MNKNSSSFIIDKPKIDPPIQYSNYSSNEETVRKTHKLGRLIFKRNRFRIFSKQYPPWFSRKRSQGERHRSLGSTKAALREERERENLRQAWKVVREQHPASRSRPPPLTNTKRFHPGKFVWPGISLLFVVARRPLDDSLPRWIVAFPELICPLSRSGIGPDLKGGARNICLLAQCSTVASDKSATSFESTSDSSPTTTITSMTTAIKQGRLTPIFQRRLAPSAKKMEYLFVTSSRCEFSSFISLFLFATINDQDRSRDKGASNSKKLTVLLDRFIRAYKTLQLSRTRISMRYLESLNVFTHYSDPVDITARLQDVYRD